MIWATVREKEQNDWFLLGEASLQSCWKKKQMTARFYKSALQIASFPPPGAQISMWRVRATVLSNHTLISAIIMAT